MKLHEPKTSTDLYQEMEEELKELREPTAQELIFEIPLYTEFAFRDSSVFRRLFVTGYTKIDGHCFQCGKESVFHSRRKNSLDHTANLLHEYNGIQQLTFICQRNNYHAIHLFIQCHFSPTVKANIDGSNRALVVGAVSKIGQTPSHADIANGGLENFAKVLGRDDRVELIRSNGLAAHGVYIGAFVYLRRVFERLLDRARYRAGDGIDQEKYEKARVAEKVEILKDYVPSFMAQNTKVYGVLSKGIHELTEEDCGNYYELMKQSCLLLLEQEKDLTEKEALEDKLRKSIEKIDLKAEK